MFLRKLKLICPSPSNIATIVQPLPSKFDSKKLLAPSAFKKEGGDYAFYMRDYKGETIKLLSYHMKDYLQNCKVVTLEEN